MIYSIFFLSPYLGTSFIAYLCSIAYLVINFTKTINLKVPLKIILLFIFAPISHLIIQLFYQQELTALITFKYFYGSVLFFLYLSLSKRKSIVNIKTLLVLLSICIIIEAVLVNSVISAKYLMNYPKTDDGELQAAGLFWGIYLRPYSIGGNASITASLVVALLSIFHHENKNRKRNWIDYLAYTAVLVVYSGTGILIMIAYLVSRSKKIKKISLNLLISIITILLINSIDSDGSSIFEKISYQYMTDIIQYKIYQIAIVFVEHLNPIEILFGRSWSLHDPMPLGGDFGWLNALEYGGVFGALLLIIQYANIKKYKATLGVLLISSFHYAAIFSLGGQLLFGYILYKNFKSE